MTGVPMHYVKQSLMYAVLDSMDGITRYNKTARRCSCVNLLVLSVQYLFVLMVPFCNTHDNRMFNSITNGCRLSEFVLQQRLETGNLQAEIC